MYHFFLRDAVVVTQLDKRPGVRLLKQEVCKARVVSMPSRELFLSQTIDYQEKILPKKIKKRVVVELGTPSDWKGIVGEKGIMLGIDQFGVSAPGEIIHDKLKFTAQGMF